MLKKEKIKKIVLIFLLLINACHFFEFEDLKRIDISGKWKIIENDDLRVSDFNYDDSKDREIIIPGNWDYILSKNKNYSSIVWLRKKIFIGKELKGKPLVLSLKEIAVSDATYVNGVFVGGIGIIPKNKDNLEYDFAWKYNRSYYVSDDITREGINVVAVRVFSHVFSGLSSKPEIMTYEDWNKNRRYKDYLPAIRIIGNLTLNLILFLFFVMAFKGRRLLTLILCAALLEAIIFILQLQIFGTPRTLEGLLRYKIILGLFTLGSFLTLIIAMKVFEIKVKLFLKMTLIMLFIVEALVLSASDASFLLKYSFPLLFSL